MATIQRAGVQRGDLALWDGVTKTASRVDATGGTVTGLTVGEFVDVLQVYGSGTARTAATIATAVANIGGTRVTLLFSTGTWTIDANVTIASNFTCYFPAGCVLSVSSGITLTVSGIAIAEQPGSLVTGSGTVVFSQEGDNGATYHRTSAERTAGVTPTNYQYPPGHLYRYGTNTTPGTTDLATSLTNALASNQAVFLPEATTRINSTVSVPDDKRIFGNGRGSILMKGANGAMLSLGKNAKIQDIYINGNGDNFTGVGVTIPYTAEFEGYQEIDGCTIFDTESYCVQYVSGAKAAGFASKISRTDMRVRGDTVPCVLWGADSTNSHGNRTIMNCAAGSGPLVDVNTADNGTIIGNLMGDNGADPGLLMGATCAKIMIIGNRIGATTTLLLSGQSCVFEGNVCGSGVTLTADWIGSQYGDNVISGTFTDSSGGQSNAADTGPITYTPTWTGGGGNPAIGNGTITGVYSRKGRHVVLEFEITMGTTTTYGTGEWRVSVPSGLLSAQPAWGMALLYDSSATPVIGTVYVAANTAYGIFYMQGVAGNVSPTAPFTWASGDFLRAQVTYMSA